MRGFCYFCTSPSRTKVTLDKLRYTPGDTAKFTLEVDNERCKFDITNFIISLERTVWIKADQLNEISHKQIIASERFEGTARGMR